MVSSVNAVMDIGTSCRLSAPRLVAGDDDFFQREVSSTASWA